MKRVVTGFFLPLFVFLSCGYTQLYAQSFREEAIFAPKYLIKADLPTDKAQHPIDATAIEEEDDQPTSSKKIIENSSATAPTSIHNYLVQRLPFSKSFVNTSSSRSYILLRVFRV